MSNFRHGQGDATAGTRDYPLTEVVIRLLAQVA